MKYIAAFIILFISATSVVSAEQTKYKQQILPIDCVYEVIDVGTQKLRYLTPETCPVDPGPPVVTEPSQGTPDTPTNWTYYAPVEVLKPTPNSSSGNNRGNNEEVKGSTERIRDVVYKNKDSALIIVVISMVWLATVGVLKKRKILH